MLNGKKSLKYVLTKMTKREKRIMEIAVEIDRLLTNKIEIHPGSPIHEKLNQALQQPAVRRGCSIGKIQHNACILDMGKCAVCGSILFI